MKCPRAIAWTWELGRKPQFSYGDCIEEECAWWDEYPQACGVLMIAFRLQYLVDILNSIENRMPHEGQFKK